MAYRCQNKCIMNSACHFDMNIEVHSKPKCNFKPYCPSPTPQRSGPIVPSGLPGPIVERGDTGPNGIGVNGPQETTPQRSREDKNAVPIKSLECTVCMDKERSILLEPCKHLALCESCANKCQECPLCRATITSKVKVIFS